MGRESPCTETLTLIQGAMTVVLSKPVPGGKIRALAILSKTGRKATSGDAFENLKMAGIS